MLDIYVNIKNRRQELGMSQETLARKVGYTNRSTITRIEKGEIDLPIGKVIDFARALHTTPGELMGWTEDDEQHDFIMPNDPELIVLIEKASSDENYRDRLLQIVKLMGDK